MRSNAPTAAALVVFQHLVSLYHKSLHSHFCLFHSREKLKSKQHELNQENSPHSKYLLPQMASQRCRPVQAPTPCSLEGVLQPFKPENLHFHTSISFVAQMLRAQTLDPWL